jgi:hypothetical protein
MRKVFLNFHITGANFIFLRRRMLDDDKRDIRIIQEAFLEDGDLHTEGGGRQRLFRWKNNGKLNYIDLIVDGHI